MRQIDEATGLNSWNLRIVKESEGVVKVGIYGPRGRQKAWVRIPPKDLLEAVCKELSKIETGS
jgi:hypothetical protein